MSPDDVIKRLIPYRLQSIGAFSMAWDWSYQWESPKELHILVDGKLILRGNTNAVINPMIEAGFVHARALLEFLGLCTTGGKLSAIKKRRPDDIGIEHFSINGQQIPLVTPDIAIATYEGDPEEAERALVSIFDISNKGFAHFSSGLVKGKWNSKDISIACKGVPILVINNLYVPLGLDPPKYLIETTTA
jgi:hypothetical protein